MFERFLRGYHLLFVGFFIIDHKRRLERLYLSAKNPLKGLF